MNDLDETDGMLFQVDGEEVMLFGPNILRITIGIPWDEAYTNEQRNWVRNKNMGVLNYLAKEGFINPKDAINCMVLTRKK